MILPLILGCESAAQKQAREAVGSFHDGDFAHSVELLKPLSQKTDQDFVLNNLRLGAAALAEYDLDGAEAAFLRAYEVLNSFGVNNGGRTLGAVLVDEKIKIWRGEPYERAMANFYLGLVYYMRQDYGNARGAFENALFKLRDYGGGEEAKDVDADRYTDVETNFALGYLMLGKSYQRLGREDLARKNFERAVELRKYLADVADFDRNADANVVLVVDYGTAPRKVTTSDGAVVGFAPTPPEVGPAPLPRVEVDGQPYDAEGINRPLVDLVQLAQDRKWQSIDTIRAVKSAVGTGLIAGGAGYGLHQANRKNGNLSSNDALVSLGLIGAGLLLKATSQADLRQWEMLPRSIHVLPLKLPPGQHQIRVTFPSGREQTWAGLEAPAKGDATYYFHMQRYERGIRQWPPAAMGAAVTE